MKKLKGNVILTTFVLSMALLALGIFGTDTAYIILSRYKLQKITEAVALEYASSLRGANNQCNSIQDEYLEVYNSRLSGIMGFEINGINYKTVSNDETVVRVRTTASILPAFLRFIGTKGIQIHSFAYAKTQRVSYNQTANIAGEEYFAEFDLSDILTNKSRGQADFTVQFNYEPFDSYSQNGGYFVFGSYKNADRWVDLGYTSIDTALQNTVPNVGICINGSNQNPVSFNLNTDNKAAISGFTKKVDKIRVYKSNGVSEDYFTGNQTASSCEPYRCLDHAPDPPAPPDRPASPPPPYGASRPDCSIHPAGSWQLQYCQNLQAGWDAWQTYRTEYAQYQTDLNNYNISLNRCMDYNENRNAAITLTVLNSVRLISARDYQNAAAINSGNCTL